MYGGVGLPTPRGTGTSGHVQRNLASVQKKDKLKQVDENKLEVPSQKVNEEILEHTRKREIELKCFELTDSLEEQGFEEEEINKKVAVYRKILVENYEKMYKPKNTDEPIQSTVIDTVENFEDQSEKNNTKREHSTSDSDEDDLKDSESDSKHKKSKNQE